jgi:curved DNA-binding protein
MEFKDYYTIMGLSRDAGEDEIKRTYRKLARKYHPDVSKEPDAEARFKELGEAYEVLKDPEKRAAYDQLGANWKAGQDFRPPPGWNRGFEFRGGGANSGQGGFSDFFETLFGRGFASGGFDHGRANGRGRDSRARVMIDLEDAYRGATRSISLRQQQVDPSGQPRMGERTLNVRIPTGVRQGQQIRLSGQGSAGRGGSGDLYLEVAFHPHSLYRVEGSDVYLELPVSPWEAALGATVNVPTPDGSVDLKIPPGSATGRKLRLKGRGIPSKPAGDLYIELKVVLPPADTDAAKESYRNLRDTTGFDPRADLGGK